MLPAFFDKAEIDGLLISQRGQRTTNGERATLGLRSNFCCDRPQRRRVRQAVVAHHTGYFLNQIFFDLQIKSIGRWHHSEQSVGLFNDQAETFQRINTLLLAQSHANDFAGTGYAQTDRCSHRHVGLLVINGAATGVGCSANLDNEP